GSIGGIRAALVRRPSLPVPGTVATSTPVSAASLRTEGASGVATPTLRSPAGGGEEATGRGRGSPSGALIESEVPIFWSGRPGDATFPAPAPSLIRPSNAPTATVSPSLAAMSASTPAAGAGTS